MDDWVPGRSTLVGSGVFRLFPFDTALARTGDLW